MIEIMEESKGKVLAVKASGKLTDEDYTEVWIPALEKIIIRYDKVNMLLYMDESFEGWELMAMWDDAKFGLQHRNDLGKVAVVGGAIWVQWGAKVGKLLVGCEVRTFESGELEESLAWIAEE